MKIEKTEYARHFFVLMIYVTIAIAVGGASRLVICISILLTGLTAIRTMHKASEDPHAGSSVLEKYGGKEVEIRLYSGRRVKGKVAQASSTDILEDFILLLDARIIEEDEDTSLRGDDLRDEVQISADQIDTIAYEDIDRASPKR